MHQAQISAWGEPPKYTETPNLSPPTSSKEVQIKVSAVGIHRVVRSRASGRHYSSSTLPHIPGIDGVGTDTSTGEKVYFFSLDHGLMAEYINLPQTSVIPLPEGVDPIQIAAGINPAMSSWMAFKSRTKDLPKDFTVLILGATSASGRVAIGLARALGARTIIGVARDESALESLDLDRRIVISSDKPEMTDFGGLDDVDVVVDYIYGPLTVHLFESLNTPKPVQYVHIGSLSGTAEMQVPGELLRSKDLTIRGAGPGSWQMRDFVKSLPELLQAMRAAPQVAVKKVRLEDVEQQWEYKGKERMVVVMEDGVVFDIDV